MPRSIIRDNLQVFRFHLMDVAPIDAFSLPVLTPTFGFNQISAPSMTLQTVDITEANWFFPKKVVKSAEVASITLSRGATFYDSDFYRWIRTAMTGNTEDFQSRGYSLGQTIALGAFEDTNNTAAAALGGAAAIAGFFNVPRIGGPSPRRDMVLIQYFAHEPFGDFSGVASVLGEAAIATLSGNVFSASGSALSLASTAIRGSFRTQAKAWKLHGCIPISYKASSDFDATVGEVSIQELEISVDGFDEISLAA